MTTPPIEYVEARRVLLNVLDALREHLDALVIVGAQAVYLRTEGRLTTYQAFTTDADLVVNLGLLGPTPPLGESLTAAGLEYTGEPGIWNAAVARPGLDQPIHVPVDLIVPEHEAPTAGRRAARLPDRHGKTTARKVAGLEGALIDHAPLDLGALEAHDPRSFNRQHR